MIVTRTHRIELGSDGILTAVTRDDWQDTFDMPEAEEFIQAIIKISADHKYPFMIIARNGKITRQARKYMSVNGILAKKIAVIPTNRLTQVLGNFFLGFNRPDTPIRLFSSEDQARDWLKSTELV